MIAQLLKYYVLYQSDMLYTLASDVPRQLPNDDSEWVSE